MNELKIKEGLILTNEEEKTIKRNDATIKIMPVYKWLLK